MDTLLFLLGFCLAIVFLWQYHDYLKLHRGFSPCQLGRTAVMALAVILGLFSQSTEIPWLLILIAAILFLLVFMLNYAQAGLLHGCLMTFWQFLACSIVLLMILLITMEKNTRVPKKKDSGSK